MRRLCRGLVGILAGPRPPHRRDWRRLWRYCRCGFRWRCPDSIELVPMPYLPVVPPLPPLPSATSLVPSASAALPARARARNTRDPMWSDRTVRRPERVRRAESVGGV
ncbi:hypothetical protein O7626_26715 [Micromonospora sp. WMMD1102]|uniref:hypothetical protein n=1 Tax=Micromonospora sp. WMMD1102 TaxID=3016105 RepID=UPI0024156850|nr:hypothetical protein [Micromonospora sp. WMMD1102]MDG4789473.1 hypothetical protein [Micromonospora sp. WMMD1102]